MNIKVMVRLICAVVVLISFSGWQCASEERSLLDAPSGLEDGPADSGIEIQKVEISAQVNCDAVEPHDMAYYGGSLYIADSHDQMIYLVASGGDNVTSNIDVSGINVSCMAEVNGVLCLQSDDYYLYYIDLTDEGSQMIKSEYRLIVSLAGMGYDGSKLWGVSAGGDTLYSLNLSGLQESSFFFEGEGLNDITYHQGYLYACSGDRLYKINSSGEKMAVYMNSSFTDIAGIASDGIMLWLIDKGKGLLYSVSL